MWGGKMRAALAGFALALLVVATMPARSQPGRNAAARCDGAVHVSSISSPGRREATQWRLYVRGTGPNANYYAFGLLPDDAYSAHAEQALLRALGIDPAKRIGDTHPSVEAAERAAYDHCRRAAGGR